MKWTIGLFALVAVALPTAAHTNNGSNADLGHKIWASWSSNPSLSGSMKGSIIAHVNCSTSWVNYNYRHRLMMQINGQGSWLNLVEQANTVQVDKPSICGTHWDTGPHVLNSPIGVPCGCHNYRHENLSDSAFYDTTSQTGGNRQDEEDYADRHISRECEGGGGS